MVEMRSASSNLKHQIGVAQHGPFCRSEPEALRQVLTTPNYHFKRIGLEAGPLSQWLYSVLTEADLPVICIETRT
jgi:transposase